MTLSSPPSAPPSGRISVPASASAVRVRGLRRTYGQGPSAYEAVRGIDLDVPAGSITALLGTNGAGKTSTLEVLEGLAAATSGEVSVLGLDPIADRAVLRRRTGVLLQRSGFSGDLTVRETLRLWSATLTSPRPVDQMLALLSLEERADVRMLALSGGETRRVDLASHADGRPGARDPRRAHDRPGPREPARGMAARVRPARRRRHRAHHHALPRGGRGARRPAGDHARRPDRPLGHAGRDRGRASRRRSASPTSPTCPATSPASAASSDEHGRTTLETDALQRSLSDLMAWAAAQQRHARRPRRSQPEPRDACSSRSPTAATRPRTPPRTA